jgi:hypothetical protein
VKNGEESKPFEMTSLRQLLHLDKSGVFHAEP